MSREFIEVDEPDISPAYPRIGEAREDAFSGRVQYASGELRLRVEHPELIHTCLRLEQTYAPGLRVADRQAGRDEGLATGDAVSGSQGSRMDVHDALHRIGASTLQAQDQGGSRSLADVKAQVSRKGRAERDR
ncbi:MAG: hypothetical protein EBT09_09210 [Actinobacteria bacterium]|nr:hypothetical protein [Actinomycetota bacterium]